MCRLLLDHGVPVDAWHEQEGQRVTALCAAILSNQLELFQLLLRRGADPNFSFHVTPLQGAIGERNAIMVRELLEAGADANARNMAGSDGVFQNGSILAVAIFYYSPDVFDELSKETVGIDVNSMVHRAAGSRRTHLHFAVIHGKGNAVKKLLEKGADPNALDDLGCTPFRLACEQSCLDCIYELFRGNPADHLEAVRAVEAPTRGSRKRRRND